MNRLIAATVFAALPLAAASLKEAVVGSQHDLSVTGAGPVRSASTSACMFCHAPHNVVPNIPPLWDHALSTQTYAAYTSSTYTSGCPRNQNRCCHSNGEPPVAGTNLLPTIKPDGRKKLVPK